MLWILLPLGVLALLSVLLVWFVRRRRRLPRTARVRWEREWERAMQLTDPHRRILDAEKILDEVLGVLGFTGGFGEKLKAAGPRLRNREAVWRAHKLRNRLAHEVGASVSERETAMAIASLHRALMDLS